MESTVNFEKEKVSSEMGNSHLLYLFKKKKGMVGKASILRVVASLSLGRLGYCTWL